MKKKREWWRRSRIVSLCNVLLHQPFNHRQRYFDTDTRLRAEQIDYGQRGSRSPNKANDNNRRRWRRHLPHLSNFDKLQSFYVFIRTVNLVEATWNACIRDLSPTNFHSHCGNYNSYACRRCLFLWLSFIYACKNFTRKRKRRANERLSHSAEAIA